MSEPGRLRSAGLAASLGVGSVVIVLLAVTAVAISSIRLLGKLADQQAITRVELAGASAREYLRRVSEDALSSARVLAERPTLQRLLTQGDQRGLQPILLRYCQVTGMDACAVFDGDSTVGTFGGDLPWDEIAQASTEQGERFLLAPKNGGPVLAGAFAALPSLKGMRAVALRAVNDRLLAEIHEQVGADVRIVNFVTYTAPPGDPFTDLHTQALSTGRAAARRLKVPAAYAATVLLAAPTGEMIGLIDARIDAAEFDASVRSLAWRLAFIALLVVAIAGIAGLLYGKWLVRPLSKLRAAADRFGQGDFSAAIPLDGVSEVGALARTMDEMRRNLVELTATLRGREAEAQAVLDGIVEGIYAVDQERRIGYVNPQIARMLGRAPEELIGQFCGDVLKPETVDGVRPCERDCPILQARTAPQGRAAERLRVAEGTVRSVVIMSSPPVQGRQIQVLRDETDLEAVRRARDGVLANISHEFRTPLAAQLASIELLQDGLEHLTTAEQRELFHNLERGVLRLMRLIDNLLESVRIEAGQLSVRSQSLALGEVIEEAAALVRPLLGQRGQSLLIDVPASLPAIVGDAQRLTQVFVNLLANASKFAPEATPIRVGSEVRGGKVVIWVEDEGPGPAEADRSALFQRFRRSEGEEPEAPGLGLGLWIVKSIVERHGGQVGMERTGGQRTRFFVELPAESTP